MKALSIQQPWAWLIVNGYKDIENREWFTRFRGDFYVHAGQKIDRDAIDMIRSMFPEIPLPDTFATGGIVGKAEMLDCVTAHDSEWFEGHYGFVLGKRTPVPFRRLRGQLGFFDVPDASAFEPTSAGEPDLFAGDAL